MKKVLLLLTMSASFAIVNAQIRAIPSPATDAFKAKYPDAQTVAWKDKITSFEASFVNGGINTDAYFTGKGDWVETDKTLTYDALPSVVKDGYTKSKYNPDWKTTDVIEIQKPDVVQYRVTVKKSGVQLKYLYFDKNGKLVKEALTL
jgi:hypothetical protein